MVQPEEKSVVKTTDKKTTIKENNDFLKIYPNPTSGKITVELDDSGNGSLLRVFDLYGRMVYQTKEKVTDGCTIDLSGLTKGIYVVKFTGEKKELLKKITVM
jgi:hypothetical protein